MPITLLAAIMATALAAPSARAETFRNAQGHIVGTASTNSSGTTTFRDSAGHQTGTARTNEMGVTTFRDPQGRQTGTATRPPDRR